MRIELTNKGFADLDSAAQTNDLRDKDAISSGFGPGSARQIGNAVSVRTARALAMEVRG